MSWRGQVASDERESSDELATSEDGGQEVSRDFRGDVAEGCEDSARGRTAGGGRGVSESCTRNLGNLRRANAKQIGFMLEICET